MENNGHLHRHVFINSVMTRLRTDDRSLAQTRALEYVIPCGDISRAFTVDMRALEAAHDLVYNYPTYRILHGGKKQFAFSRMKILRITLIKRCFERNRDQIRLMYAVWLIVMLEVVCLLKAISRLTSFNQRQDPDHLLFAQPMSGLVSDLDYFTSDLRLKAVRTQGEFEYLRSLGAHAVSSAHELAKSRNFSVDECRAFELLTRVVASLEIE